MRSFPVVFLFLVVTVTSINLPAQVFTNLVNFEKTNGYSPAAPLIQGTDGKLYGTTPYGGEYEGGTAFNMTLDGTLTSIYNFCSLTNCTDGDGPWAPLLEGIDGNLYGTTMAGGGVSSIGTVFKLTPQGTLTPLYSFGDGSSEGDAPVAGLVQGGDGNFYGTAEHGGNNDCGTVFKITPEGQLTTLYQFSGPDGRSPGGGLVLASDGNFYGTTIYGGTGNLGTIFQITPDGSLTTIHNFDYTDGAIPLAGLIEATDGNLYGTTSAGGVDGYGTVFKSTFTGRLTPLYSFCSQLGCTDGAGPRGVLVQATDGNFYGTTSEGGANECSSTGCGTIFQITPAGTLTTLHSFNGNDGYQPYAGLIQANDGNFYGTTYQGGDYNTCPNSGCGTIFRLNDGLSEPILSVSKSGSGLVSSVDEHIYCGDACSYSYMGGTLVTLSAVPAPGYTFSGWTGCDNVNGGYCSLTMNGAKNVTATFPTANSMLASLAFNPSYVRGGQLSAGTLMLTAPAPPGGVTVALSSDHPGVAHPPAFVFVPGNASSVQFAVETFPVNSNTTVTITATAGSSQINGTFTVGTTSLPPALK